MFASPLIPGPLMVAGAPSSIASGFVSTEQDCAVKGTDVRRTDVRADERPDGAATDSNARREETRRLERLWEFRLCIEHLRECFEGFEANGECDALSTAAETLGSVEETLRRVAVLGVVVPREARQRNATPPMLRGFVDATPPRRASAAGPPLLQAGSLPKGRRNDAEDRMMQMQAIRSLSSQRGAFTQQLLDSKLGISGLLEAVFGELTHWQTRPSDSDLRVWQRWDRAYESLARRAGVLHESWERLLVLDSRCCQSDTCPLPAGVRCASVAGGKNTAFAEHLDVRPQVCSTALCFPVQGT